MECIYSRQRKIKGVDCAVSLVKIAALCNDNALKSECDMFLASNAENCKSILYMKVIVIISIYKSNKISRNAQRR